MSLLLEQVLLITNHGDLQEAYSTLQRSVITTVHGEGRGGGGEGEVRGGGGEGRDHFPLDALTGRY